MAKQPPPNGEHRLRSENLAFDIDVWYPPLSQHTFRTVFLPMTRQDAEALVAVYNISWRGFKKEALMTRSLVETLLRLESRIDRAIRTSFGTKGAFLRLCGRSPKDGEPTDPCAREKVWSNYKAALSKATQTEGQDDEGNHRVVAIARTESWLRVKSGADAMSLLLTSERVFSDMLDWLHYGEPEQIVLREWSDSFDLSTEFRCYIQNGKLVGISQYDTYAKFSFLQEPEQREIVIRAVVHEWMKVQDCIETMDGSYCADFGVDMENQTALLIELSPFRRCTGPAMFAWKEEALLDFAKRGDATDHVVNLVLENDSIHRGAVFRVRSKSIPKIGDLVEMNWDFRWSEERIDTPKPYKDLYFSVVGAPTFADRIQRWFSEKQQSSRKARFLLFVYGTLKRGCHWNAKYLSVGEFVGKARTVDPQSLVIGQCGVPYLLQLGSNDPDATHVNGELWRISEETLHGIDDYEGVQKGHYTRQEILVASASCTSTKRKAFCYFYAVKPGAAAIDSSLLQAERITEYPSEEQHMKYKPIHHIQAKQLQYLGEEATT